MQAHRAHPPHGPLIIAILGCSLLAIGYVAFEAPVVVWSGVAVLLGGSVGDVLLARRRSSRLPMAAG